MALGSLLLLRADFQSIENALCHGRLRRGAVPVAMPPLVLAVVLFGLLLQGFALVPIAHRLGLVLPSEESEPT